MKAVRHPPQYTMDQMICKAITAIQISGVMPQHLLEWNGFEDAHKNWANLRPHFAEALMILLAVNQGKNVRLLASQETRANSTWKN